MENMLFYNQLKQPPTDALKPIVGGRLKGKTDISPQWRVEAMTELFGPCGIGWKYTIDRMWHEPGTDGQVFAFVNVSLYFLHSECWSEPIPGTGGSMLIAKETGGLFNSDEAYKMATTDALSVAFKALGMAADVYRGFLNGSKYDKPASKPAQETEPDRSSLVKFTPKLAVYSNWVKWFAVDKQTGTEKLAHMRKSFIIDFQAESELKEDAQKYKINNNIQ